MMTFWNGVCTRTPKRTQLATMDRTPVVSTSAKATYWRRPVIFTSRRIKRPIDITARTHIYKLRSGRARAVGVVGVVQGG